MVSENSSMVSELITPPFRTMICLKYSPIHFFLPSFFRHASLVIRFPKWMIRLNAVVLSSFLPYRFLKNATVDSRSESIRAFFLSRNSLFSPCQNRHGHFYGLAICSNLSHTIDQRSDSVKRSQPVIRCIYSDDKADLASIIRQSFLLFLQRELYTFDHRPRTDIS